MNFSVLSPKYSLDLEVQNGVVFFFFKSGKFQTRSGIHFLGQICTSRGHVWLFSDASQGQSGIFSVAFMG